MIVIMFAENDDYSVVVGVDDGSERFDVCC